jgi:uncharacterized membrane protein YuzA (DUF378 family)
MYQSYPGSAQMSEVQRPPAPVSIRTAVRFMYAGAAASLILTVIELATLSTTKSNFIKHSHNLTASQANGLQHTLAVGAIAGGLISIAAWIIIARACGAGQNWARITGTVLFGIATIDAISYLAVPFAAPVKAFTFVLWLAALGAIVFLWRATSSAYFRSTPS